MKVLVHVEIPHEPFNTYVREGTAGQKIGAVLEATKPEAIYFTEQDGQRGCVAVYTLDRDSGIPALAEPWFLTFKARCRLRVAMTPEDLGASGLDEMGKRWR